VAVTAASNLIGTLPYEIMAGVTAAVDLLAGIAPDGGNDRRARLESGLAAMAPRVVLHSRAAERALDGLRAFLG
jgi:hypothetical protein